MTRGPDHWRDKLKAVGPGILFAGAAIGVSHLVQSTRAGAGYGFGLLWAVLLALIFKYPFFLFAHRYTVASCKSLLEGYRDQGRWALGGFMLVVLTSSFITTAAVTVVTAGLAGALLGVDLSLPLLSLFLLALVMVILGLGHYRLLDGMMKAMVLVLGVLTLVAVVVAVGHGPAGDPNHVPPDLYNAAGLTFLLALMGWMPAPLDIGAWSSLWILEKSKVQAHQPTMFQTMMDFHIGYLACGILAVAFVAFGALVMFGTGTEFSGSGLGFARQLVDMYTGTLGAWSRWIISLVAFITMFSTTLTVLDGYARTLDRGLTLLLNRTTDRKHTGLYMAALAGLAMLVIAVFMSSMKALVDVATVLAFLTAPFVAVLNYRAMRSETVPPGLRPGLLMSLYSTSGILFLLGFGLFWIWLQWVR